MSSHQLNSKTNDLVLLLKTIWRYWNSFLLPVATDGMDGNGLRFEKIGQFDATCSKNSREIYYVEPFLIKFIWYLCRSFTEAFCLWFNPSSNDFSTEFDLKQQNPRDHAPLITLICWTEKLVGLDKKRQASQKEHVLLLQRLSQLSTRSFAGLIP